MTNFNESLLPSGITNLIKKMVKNPLKAGISIFLIWQILKPYLNKKENFEENITIPINIGDTILGGKFKNRKIVVKSIGKNDKGEVIINGKPLMKYRIIPKELFKRLEDIQTQMDNWTTSKMPKGKSGVYSVKFMDGRKAAGFTFDKRADKNHIFKQLKGLVGSKSFELKRDGKTILTDRDFKKGNDYIMKQLESFSEMAVVSKVKETKTPIQRMKEADELFKRIMNKSKDLIKADYFLYADKTTEKDISLYSGRATGMYGGTFDFKYKPGDNGYYEINKELESKVEEFKKQVKKILKINWKDRKPKFTNHIYGNSLNASFSIMGKIIFKQVVAYLYDKNINKKIKLGTYSSKIVAEDEAGSLYGFAYDSEGHGDDKKYVIYYWSKSGKRKDYKTFDDLHEMSKYLDKIEISIEEVAK